MTDFPGNRLRPINPRFRKKQKELFPAPACADVLASYADPYDIGDLYEDFIACIESVIFVNKPEIVNIGKNNREGALVALRTAELLRVTCPTRRRLGATRVAARKHRATL